MAQLQESQINMGQGDEGAAVPLRESRTYIKELFDRYDTDRDGRISIHELKHLIEHHHAHDLPAHTIQLIMKISDTDNSGYLSFKEFRQMIRNPELQSVFGHAVNKYVRNICVPRGGDTVDGEYEDSYSCCPPPLSMVVISIIELVFFIVDIVNQHGVVNTKGPLATLFVYNPFQRHEAWRFMTYMFVHAGYTHLIVNLLVQLFLGIALELVHSWWRVVLVYLSGVLAGSLGTSLTSPRVFLAGASGGVYALVTAHIATIILNWAQMQFAILQLLVFLVLVGVDVGNTIYTSIILGEETNIGYMAHLAGAIAGLLVGIGVLKNLKKESWEKKLWWVAMGVYTALMLFGILWNIFYTDHFPPTHWY